MKKIVLITSLSFFIPFFAHAQIETGFNYQAVARDQAGLILADTPINLRFQIREGTSNGPVIFQETHSPETNTFGLFQAVIGKGSPEIGTFSQIEWENEWYFLVVELNGSAVDTSFLEAVPYAKVATDMPLDALSNVELATPPLADQALTWNGSEWTAAYVAGSEYFGGEGIQITGDTISNSAPDQIVNLSGSGATTVSGSYPNFTVSSTDKNTTYTAGTGLTLTGTVFSNTGDTNPGDDITTATTAGGDLVGMFPSPTVAQIQGQAVSSSAPSNGQVLKWNGSAWTPSTDNNTDSDADPANEIQSLSLSGADLSLSNGGGTVSLPSAPTYTGGTGINITGTTISNTDPDQIISLSGSGATTVSGSYPNFTVSSTDNVNDADSNPNNEIQSLSISGTTLSLSNGGGSVGLSAFLSPWTTSGSNIYRTSGNIGIGTTAPVTPLQVYANRDVLFGSSMAGTGSRFIWDYSSRAIRAGYAAASSWNEDSIGLYSAAFGFGSVAGAYMSFAHGFYSHARTYAGFSIGRYNVGATGTATSWVTSDPLFEVGNGTSNTNRNNAFTIRKDGRVGINDATPDYLVDIENPELSTRSIYINHDISTSSSTMYGIYVNADNIAANSGISYGAYFDMTNTNDDAYGQYSLAFCDAIDGSPAYAVRSYVDNDNGTGWAYAIYGSVSGSTTGSKYGGYFNGNVYTTGSYLPSDLKLKRNLLPMENALGTVLQMEVKSYEYEVERYPHMNLPTGPRVGFVAQNIKQVLPGLVKKSVQPAPTEEEIEDGMPPGEDIEFEAVDYAGMVPYLVKAIQEQQSEIERLRQQILDLQQSVDAALAD